MNVTASRAFKVVVVLLAAAVAVALALASAALVGTMGISRAYASSSSVEPADAPSLRAGDETSVSVQATKKASAKASAGKASAKAKAKKAKAKKTKAKKVGKWKVKRGFAYYKKPNGKFAKGLYTIGKKTYLFDKTGKQLTGWQYYKGAYRYFKIANEAKGYMVKDKVVNGIALRKSGKAKATGTALEELQVMVKAQQLAESLTTPYQSKQEKLQRGFDWMRYECTERGLHPFADFPGWHRMFANDILDIQTGSCYSYGAALAYYANAVGYKSCRIVSSGGHGWAEIGGKVYDVEWSRVTGNTYFAFPYSSSGIGAPNYAPNRAYVVQIAPNANCW